MGAQNYLQEVMLRGWIEMSGYRICENWFMCVLFVGMLVCFTGSCRIREQLDDKVPQTQIEAASIYPSEAVTTFIRRAQASDIDKVSLSYERWEIMYSHGRASERDLMVDPRGFRLTLRDDEARMAALELANALAERKLKRSNTSRSELDFGLGAVFYSQGRPVLSLCVSKSLPAISINGDLFDPHPHVVYPLMALLPSEARRSMTLYLLYSWGLSSGRDRGADKEHQGSQGEDSGLNALTERLLRRNDRL